ncbi:MAG: tyrosine--tRNA ligase [Candidatus Aenigmarchaeota archaeon]|nr:tyrosine--tRNA ligase [Candidatus Aenigmarchaeota archaeon]
MDTEARLELVRGVGEEIITMEELRQLLETKQHPVAYDGFEPSGLAPIHFGVFRALLLQDLLKAGVHFKLWLADWFAWINNKMDGDLEAIHKVGEYFIEVWKGAGLEEGKNLKFLWASEHMDADYWKRVVQISKITTMNRANRCLTIMGRKEGEMKEVAQYFYPMMQCSDIFELEADITQLGMDQRKVNILAREVGPKLGLWKPVVVSHHMLMSLEGVKQPEGYEENQKLDIEISSKMSKSKPSSAIFVHDSKQEIAAKMNKAFCEPKNIENNPVLEYCRHMVFRKFDVMAIERPTKFGGSLSYASYQELEAAFRDGKLHPADLKMATALYIDKLVQPIRTHFEKDKKAKELYEFVRSQDITR